MAIRVEFYAKDQVTASSIVEFALSSGAVLHSYNKIEPPLIKEAPPKPKRAYNMKKRDAQPESPYKSGRKKRHDYDNTYVVVMDRTNNSTPGSKIWDIKDIILSHRQPTSLAHVRKAVFSGAPESISTTVRKTIREFISEGILEIVEPPTENEK